jgi:hypothetical protein
MQIFDGTECPPLTTQHRPNPSTDKKNADGLEAAAHNPGPICITTLSFNCGSAVRIA